MTQPARPRDDDLMAFADGAATAAQRARVEPVAEDPDVRAAIENFRRSRAALAHAFDAPLYEPTPERLRSVMETPVFTDRARTRPRAAAAARAAALRTRPALVAGLAAAVIGASVLGFSLGVVARRATPETLDVLVGLVEDGTPLAVALGQTRSGTTARVDERSVLRPVLSVLAEDGRVCREARVQSEGEANVLLACREPGGWRIELFAAASSPLGEGPAIAGGASEGHVDAALERLGAGSPLTMPQEQCAMAADWYEVSARCSADCRSS